MEFTGAVLVDNIKIKVACDKFKVLYNENNNLIWGLLVKAEGLYQTLTKWEKWWYDSDYCGKAGYYLQRKSPLIKHWHNSCDHMEALGWITDKQNTLYHSNSKSVYNDLKAMIQAGEPVYLSPEQCKFVNEYYKGED